MNLDSIFGADADNVAAVLRQKVFLNAPKPIRVLIDGPSGSGKTTLAEDLSQRIGGTVLHLDDMYEGWDGLSVGTKVAESLILGESDSFQRWDWASDSWGEIIQPNPFKHWIIEGCGAITRRGSTAADLVVWVETDLQTAKQRALSRDGEMFAPRWDSWRQQELTHWRKHSPKALADVVVST